MTKKKTGDKSPEGFACHNFGFRADEKWLNRSKSAGKLRDFQIACS
jgi:hypothetical protein